MKKLTLSVLLSALMLVFTGGLSAEEEMYTLDGKEFSPSETTLYLRNQDVRDISVLANCTALENLDLSYTQVSDISPLVGLDTLKALNLEGLGLDDISLLENLKQLESLNLRGNPITDYSVLGNFPNLKELSVDDVEFADILQYIDLSLFTSLTATNCAIHDLSILENSPDMTT